MKNHIIILFLVLVLFSSCEDNLQQTPISDLSVPGFYSTETEFIQGANAVYESLRDYPIWQYYLFDVRSDNFYANSQTGVRSHDPVNTFATNLSSNEYMSGSWNNSYEGIMRANTVLDNLETSSDIITDNALRLRLEAEAKFLRAFFYFDLVQTFGKVPIITKVTNAEVALNIPRSPVSDVYDLIISDLQFAISNLDDFYPKGDANCGRATKNAARGILARVYLARSGDDFGIEGPGMNTDEYQLALDQLNVIIDNASGKYGMATDYASIFKLANENSEEIVWDIQYISGGLGVGASYPGEMGGSGWWSAQGITFAIGLENKDLSQYVINSFDSVNDSRFAASVELKYLDITNSTDDSLVYIENDPTCIKFLSKDPAEWGVDRFDFPINFPILRYTDILLMKAECILQGASGTQEEVNTIINDVRARVGLTPLPGDATLDDLLDERQKEFLCEGLRWHDLVRTGKVLEVINDWIPDEDIQNKMRDNYPVQAYNIIYPVPFAQIEVKEGLYEQNPGYY